uniref:Uncharacterized protein n=1 Tax=Arundo donax TaxID=35708 RepID=A0A0A9GUG2_ARUDO
MLDTLKRKGEDCFPKSQILVRKTVWIQTLSNPIGMILKFQK